MSTHLQLSLDDPLWEGRFLAPGLGWVSPVRCSHCTSYIPFITFIEWGWTSHPSHLPCSEPHRLWQASQQSAAGPPGIQPGPPPARHQESRVTASRSPALDGQPLSREVVLLPTPLQAGPLGCGPQAPSLSSHLPFHWKTIHYQQLSNG